jgi:hypothetical protein
MVDEKLIMSHRSWAEKYEKALIAIKRDLELILEHNSKIYIAIDFHDLFEHCFSIEHLNLDKQFPEKEMRIKRSISRNGLFYILNNIYESPIILLPPYISELNDLNKLYAKKIMNVFDSNEQLIKLDRYIKIY